jgi:phosphonopyruvate decarboxylase
MIEASRFVTKLTNLGVELFTGVPDSLLKPLNAEILRRIPREAHVIGANEGACVALAIGHYLRTGRPGVVYLQNSGFGNVVNPLLSLADPDVYGVPMLLLVGWRGQPGVKDEPQHVKQGRIMTDLLNGLGLPWEVLPTDADATDACLERAIGTAHEQQSPYVLLIEKGSFEEDAGTVGPTDGPYGDEQASREEALAAVIDALGPETINVSTTGMLSRELFELRGEVPGGERDFLTVGGMGHASSIALGVARSEPTREVWCLDGDGALLMHLGALAIIADHGPANFYHVVFNNGVHDSVGGQPTSISVVDVPTVARALGYRSAASTSDLAEVPERIAEMRRDGGPCLLEVRVLPGNRPGIGRPTRTPAEAKEAFMADIRREAP